MAVNRKDGNFLMIIGLLGNPDFTRMSINLNSDELANEGVPRGITAHPKQFQWICDMLIST